jgi:uncharacterized membrane protein
MYVAREARLGGVDGFGGVDTASA